MSEYVDRPGCNYALGYEIEDMLYKRGLETPRDPNKLFWSTESINPSYIAGNIESTLGVLGLDLDDDSLRETPRRVAKMYLEEVFRGLDYRNFPKCTTIENKMRVDEIVLCKDIAVYSTCEHHLVPFTGVAHVGYIPKDKILGLSKFNRIVDFFSRRTQVQERLTEQVYATLSYILGTVDVAVVFECTHHCVRLRGVKDVNSSTITSKMGGRFLTKPEARMEFLKLAKGH